MTLTIFLKEDHHRCLFVNTPLLARFIKWIWIWETHGGVLLYRSNTSTWMFFTFFALYKWYRAKRLIYLQKQSPRRVCEKGVLRNFAKFTGKYPGGAWIFIKKETLAQVFSCEFCEISKNTFFYKTPLVAASLLTYFS